MTETAIQISPCEASTLLTEGDTVHTLNFFGNVAMGCTWSRQGAIEKLHECEFVTFAGPTVRSMGHGIAARENDGDWIFFATDEAKLTACEALHMGGVQ